MNHGKCIISGYIAGRKFRPSNWSERLCEAGATLDPVKRIMRYSEHLYPRQCDNYGCSVHVDFDAIDIDLARYVGWFIDSNGLEVISLQEPIPLPSFPKSAVGKSRRNRCSKAA
ncbi:MAG: DUF3579 domain-containing protein [Thiolinea sp.]